MHRSHFVDGQMVEKVKELDASHPVIDDGGETCGSRGSRGVFNLQMMSVMGKRKERPTEAKWLFQRYPANKLQPRSAPGLPSSGVCAVSTVAGEATKLLFEKSSSNFRLWFCTSCEQIQPYSFSPFCEEFIYSLFHFGACRNLEISWKLPK